MDLEKIGLFIKQLRKENKMSQQKLADMIPIDRTGLSRWENGEVQPPIDKMKILCEIFNISVDELISGERTNISNKAEQRRNLFDYLISQDSKYKRIKRFLIIALIVLFLCTILFLSYYFYQTYNSERTYKIYTMSGKYVIKNGMLLTTRETSYFKIGAINDKTQDIILYYKKGNEDIIIFKGDSDSLLVNLYYEKSPINSKQMKNISENLYVKINDEEVKLYFNEFHKNKKIIFNDWEDEFDIENQVQINGDSTIPKIIKKEFKCDENICNKLINDINIFYTIYNNILFLKDGDITIQYDISNDIFDFNSTEMNFNIDNGVFTCNTDNCKNYEKMYEKYFTKIIKRYI